MVDSCNGPVFLKLPDGGASDLRADRGARGVLRLLGCRQPLTLQLPHGDDTAKMVRYLMEASA